MLFQMVEVMLESIDERAAFMVCTMRVAMGSGIMPATNASTMTVTKWGMLTLFNPNTEGC